MGRVYKRGSSYYVDFTDATGKRHRIKAGSKKRLADSLLADCESKVLRNERIGLLDRRKVRFEDLAEEWLTIFKGRWTKRTIITYQNRVRSKLNPVFGRWFIDQISRDQIEAYLAYRRQDDGMAPATVNRELAALKTILNWAVRREFLDKNPAADIKLMKEPKGRIRCLGLNEAQKLLDSCSPRIKPLVATALFTGMRLGELLSLIWSDIDWENRLIRVGHRSESPTKNKEARIIPISDDLHEILAAIPRHINSENVFHKSRGGRYTSIRRSFGNAVEASGIQDFRFHDLRHTWASRMIEAGCDLRTLQELGGWKQLSMVERYTHVNSASARKFINRMQVLGTNMAQTVSR